MISLDVPDVAQHGYPLETKRVVTRAEVPGLSITWVRISRDHKRMRMDEPDRSHYVIDGTGSFQGGDQRRADVDHGDFVAIPTGIPGSFTRQMACLVTNRPAFRPGSDVVLE